MRHLPIIFMAKWSVLLLIICGFCHKCFAQRKITTLSGQHIILYSNGQWQNYVPNETKLDSSGLLINDLNPMTQPVADTLSDMQNQAWAYLYETAKLKEIEHFIVFDSLDKAMAYQQIALTVAKKNKDKSAYKSIKNEIDVLEKTLDQADSQYKKVASQVMDISQIPSLSARDQVVKIKEYNTIFGFAKVEKPIIEPSNSTPKEKKVIVTLSHPDCIVLRDEKIQKTRFLETGQTVMVTYTPEKLKTYFKLKDLMQISSAIYKEGKHYFLKLYIKVISKDAAKNYGIVQRGNLLKITLISGKSINSNAIADAMPSIENYTGHNYYQILYPLTNDDINALEKTPLDTLGMMWSSGFESYDIYDVDVLMQQINCVKSID